MNSPGTLRPRSAGCCRLSSNTCFVTNVRSNSGFGRTLPYLDRIVSEPGPRIPLADVLLCGGARRHRLCIQSQRACKPDPSSRVAIRSSRAREIAQRSHELSPTARATAIRSDFVLARIALTPRPRSRAIWPPAPETFLGAVDRGAARRTAGTARHLRPPLAALAAVLGAGAVQRRLLRPGGARRFGFDEPIRMTPKSISRDTTDRPTESAPEQARRVALGPAQGG